jgi:pyruvate dehydrogenase complex dehydrogenase (E1) component
MASAAATRAQPCAVSSRSTAITWYWAALTALRERGQVDAKTCAEAIARYGLAPDVLAPWLA